MDEQSELKTADQLAAFFVVSKQSIRRYRTKLGMPFVKVSPNAIRYSMPDVLKWCDEQNAKRDKGRG